MTDRIKELEEENRILRATIQAQKRQMKNGMFNDEVRRLRAKLAEWEGSSARQVQGYHHGDRLILPFLDIAPDEAAE